MPSSDSSHSLIACAMKLCCLSPTRDDHQYLMANAIPPSSSSGTRTNITFCRSGRGSISSLVTPASLSAAPETSFAAATSCTSAGVSNCGLARLGPACPAVRQSWVWSFGTGTFCRCRHSGLGHRTFLPAFSIGSSHLCSQKVQTIGMVFGPASSAGASDRADIAAASTSIGGAAGATRGGPSDVGCGIVITLRHIGFLHVAFFPANSSLRACRPW